MDVGPLSSISSMRPPRSASTCAAQVDEIRFEVFALGAARGWPTAAINFRATIVTGTLRATVSRPPLTIGGIRLDLRRTMVSGPGQNWLARHAADSGQSAT